MTDLRRRTLTVVLVAALTTASAAVTACGASGGADGLDPAAHAVALPGAPRGIDFGDIAYSRRLGRVLVPARQSGLYVIDPRGDEVRRLGHLRAADSVDEG